MKTIKEKTISGLSWSFLNQFLSQIFSIGFAIILARLLTPKEFGLVAMVTVFTGFANVISDFSIGVAIIHKKEITQKELSSAFWLNTIFGIFLAGIIVLFSGAIANFYETDILKLIAIVISINYFFSSINIVQNALLKKNLEFKKIFIIQFTAIFFSGIIAVVLALNGYKVWALVFQSVAQYFFITLVTWLISGWRPSFHFNWDELVPFLKFSIPVFGTKVINYFARTLDNLLIGKNFGSLDLGVYSRAYTFMRLPVNNFAIVLHNVMFPSFSVIQDDNFKIKSIFLKIIETAALFIFPLLVLLYLIADDFVIFLLGEKWEAMIPIFKIFCFAGALETLITLTGSVFMSKGKTKLLFYIGTASRVLLIIGILYGLQFDVVSIAKYFCIATAISTPLFLYFAGKCIDTSLIEIIRVLIPIVITCVVIYPIVYFVSIIGNDYSLFLKLFTQTILSFGAYFIIIYFLKLESFKFILDLLNTNLRKVFNK